MSEGVVFAAEIQLRCGRTRLTRANVLRGERLTVVTLMFVDALLVLYDLTRLRHFL